MFSRVNKKNKAFPQGVSFTHVVVNSTIESVPGTNQYWAMKVIFLARGNNGSLESLKYLTPFTDYPLCMC